MIIAARWFQHEKNQITFHFISFFFALRKYAQPFYVPLLSIFPIRPALGLCMSNLYSNKE